MYEADDPAQYVWTQARADVAVSDKHGLRQNRRSWPPTFERVLRARKTADWLLDQGGPPAVIVVVVLVSVSADVLYVSTAESV